MFKSWFNAPPPLKLQIQQRSFKINAADTLLQSALLHGLQIPHGCRAGGCGLCKCRLLSGNVKPHPEIIRALTIEEIRDGIIYACCSIPMTDIEIELLNASKGGER